MGPTNCTPLRYFSVLFVSTHHCVTMSESAEVHSTDRIRGGTLRSRSNCKHRSHAASESESNVAWPPFRRARRWRNGPTAAKTVLTRYAVRLQSKVGSRRSRAAPRALRRPHRPKLRARRFAGGLKRTDKTQGYAKPKWTALHRQAGHFGGGNIPLKQPRTKTAVQWQFATKI